MERDRFFVWLVPDDTSLDGLLSNMPLVFTTKEAALAAPVLAQALANVVDKPVQLVELRRYGEIIQTTHPERQVKGSE